jgi:hypothetical protein
LGISAISNLSGELIWIIRFTHAGIKRATLGSREHMLVSGNPDVIREATSSPGRGIGSDQSPFASSHKGRWDADGSSDPTNSYPGATRSDKRNGAWAAGGASDPTDSYDPALTNNQQQRRAAESNDVRRR